MKTGKRRMEAGRKRRKTNEAVAPPVIEEDEHDKLMKLETPLLPGIPDHVTLEHITTKLPWRTFPILRSVSVAWHQAIKDRLIHNVRHRKHSTQTLVVLNHVQSDDRGHPESGRISAIALYSLRDKIFHHLPPIPEVHTGLPWRCQCIAVDGKIYILGGTKDATSREPPNRPGATNHLGSQDVYVFDLAAQRQWKRCAQMKDGRLEFGCGAINGKIYVFGGTSLCKPVHRSEVYDPVLDAWSPIKSKNDVRFNHDVTTVGEELYVYCGELISDRAYAHKLTYGLKAYNPLSNTWRILSNYLRTSGAGYMLFNRFFLAQGNVYSMSPNGIHVYDIINRSRRIRHLFSFAAIEKRRATAGLSQFVIRKINEVLHVDDELLAIVSFVGRVRVGHYVEVPILVKSTGFNTENKRIVWEEVLCPLFFDGRLPSPFKGIMQL